MLYPEKFLFTKSHEWVSLTIRGEAYVGISDYAQKELGDIVFVNLPAVGDEVTLNEPFGDVESVKAVSEIISPFTGTVAEVNEALLDQPQRINEAPFEAWMIRVTAIRDHEYLLSQEEYEAFLAEEK
jgi:glycine cleavage system H protein